MLTRVEASAAFNQFNAPIQEAIKLKARQYRRVFAFQSSTESVYGIPYKGEYYYFFFFYQGDQGFYIELISIQPKVSSLILPIKINDRDLILDTIKEIGTVSNLPYCMEEKDFRPLGASTVEDTLVEEPEIDNTPISTTNYSGRKARRSRVSKDRTIPILNSTLDTRLNTTRENELRTNIEALTSSFYNQLVGRLGPDTD